MPEGRAAALRRLKENRECSEQAASVDPCPLQEDNEAGAVSGLGDRVPVQTVLVPVWRCNVCQVECVPVRSESRCLCGHRLKEHAMKEGSRKMRCGNCKCRCSDFFFIVAEGSWILRCQCKHKHTEHDPVSKACTRAACRCEGFHSPWHCNCNHPWAEHTQLLEEKQVQSLASMLARLQMAPQHAALAVADTAAGHDMAGWDHVKRGQENN